MRNGIPHTIFLLAGLQLLFACTLLSQPGRDNLPDNETNFYKIRAEFTKYMAGRKINPRSGEEGNPWIPFKRWEWFMEPRVYPTGELPSPDILHSRLNDFRTSRAVQATSGGSWALLGPSVIPSSGGEGRINTIAINPSNTNIIWAGAASGGLWKSTNGGSSWATTTDEFATLGISAIAFDPTNPDTMYIATGDADALDTYSVGILKSTDGGSSWSPTGLSWATSLGFSIYALVVHPSDPNILLAAGRQGIFRTTDAGATWSTVVAGNFKDLAVNPSDPTVWYAALSTVGVYKSTNTGLSFGKLTGGLPSSGFGRIAIALAPSLPSTLYALYVNTAYGFYGLYESTDSGANWTLRSNSPNILSWDGTGTDGQGWYDLVLDVAPDNPSTVFVGGINLYRSTSSGATGSWAQLTNWYTGTSHPYIHADQHALAFLPGSGSTFFEGNDGGVFQTTNSGASWTDKSGGLTVSQFYRLGGSATDSGRIYAGAQDNGTDRFLNGSWAEILGGDGMETIVDYTNENVGYAELYYGDIYRTTNGGNAFSEITGSIADQGAWVTPYVMNPLNPRSLYVGYKGIYKSTDRGSSWLTLTSQLDPQNPLNSLIISPTDTNTLYAATYSRAWVTTNGGSSWNEITSGLPTGTAAVTYLAVDPSNQSTAYATFSGYGSQKVFTTTNFGASWTNISTGLPQIPVNCIALNPSAVTDLYAGTDAGVYYSSNRGLSWNPFSTGLPNVVIDELEVHSGTNKLRAATFGRGLWESPLAIQVTGSISGVKFKDVNGDGVREPADSGLAGWVIHISVASPPSVLTTTTDGNGHYSFANLTDGTYTVSEVQQSGWTQTLPGGPGTYTVVLSPGENATGFDFGNQPQPASIGGTIFEDTNGDSLKEGPEPGLQNWLVRLGGVLTDSTLSDSAGNYGFSNLAPGSYTVSIPVQPGWHRTRPAGGSYVMTLPPGASVTGKDFGNVRFASLSGMKFNDLNRNGVDDSGEVGLPNWVFHLSGPVSRRATTDSSGSFACTGLPPGTYTVSESVQVGWVQTLPAGNLPYTVVLPSGIDTAGFVFGNHFSPEKIYSVLEGWNLLSLPRETADRHKSSVYPSAVSNAFAYAGAYQRIDTLSIGTGFWLKFPSVQNISVDGSDVLADTIDLATGWNIIGALTAAVPVSGLVQIPGGFVSSNYYSYGSTGYQIADSLLPHHGYWVRTGTAGQLVLSPSSAAGSVARAGAGHSAQTGSSHPRPNTITVTDKRGRSRTLFVDCLADPVKDAALFELPPVPPDGAFDVRYGTGSLLAVCNESKPHDIPVLISSAEYPLRLSWDMSGETTAISLSVDQREISLMETGEIIIAAPPSKMVLRLGHVAPAELPAGFSLGQNYPNPFNPVTTVAFVLPATSPVTLSVYDVLGREVATLTNGVKEPGTYRVEWDASDFPSGVYTCRLVAGGFTAVKRMILAK